MLVLVAVATTSADEPTTFTAVDEPKPAPVSWLARSTWTAAKIKKIREKAIELSLPGENDPSEPEGWSKCRFDPGRLVDLFATLRLKRGYVLRAYVFREEGNGNGVVWAMPADSEFPEPGDCPTLQNHMLNAPKPFDALDDVMEAIEGDGSAQSYLEASLLRRELREFGAMWHGCTWGAHVVLDENPWKKPLAADASPLDGPTSPIRQWKWKQAIPDQWAPLMQRKADRVTVTFYTYGCLDREGIYRHRDTYRTGKYRAKVEQQKIGEGPGTFAF